MKREILFRGLSFSGEWVYGCLIQYENSSQIGVLKYADVMDFVKVRTETVCQFTGLTDKNGKRVFEGDVLNGFNYRVAYKDGCFCITNEYGLVRYWLNYENCNLENLKVIGNIHDNHDLS